VRLLATGALALVLATAGCEEDAPVPVDAAPGSLEFGDPCSDPAQCASGICFEFGDGSRLCSLRCTSDEECPDGSRGRNCNEQGYCRG